MERSKSSSTGEPASGLTGGAGYVECPIFRPTSVAVAVAVAVGATTVGERGVG
jgi:hypothetical protein